MRFPSIGRVAFLWGVGVAIVLFVVGATVFVLVAIGAPWSLADRLVLIGDVVVGATLLLAALAAIVALAAYRVSIQAPDLEAELKFFWCPINSVTLIRGQPDGAAKDFPLMSNRPSKTGHGSEFLRQLELSIRLRNRRPWSARNPALTLYFDGFLVPQNAFTVTGPGGWDVYRRNKQNSVTALRWEGGADRSIHGKETRNLPTLNLEGMRWTSEHPSITIELFAEGFHRTSKLPVELVSLDEWDARNPSPVGGGFDA